MADPVDDAEPRRRVDEDDDLADRLDLDDHVGARGDEPAAPTRPGADDGGAAHRRAGDPAGPDVAAAAPTAAEDIAVEHAAEDHAAVGASAAEPPAADRPAGAEGPAVPATVESPPAAGPRRSRRARRADTSRRPAPWWELPALVGLAIVIAVLVKSFLVQPFYIPSQSMEKTLHGCPGCAGDRILVSKVVYDFRDPHPGDIVVFNAPPGWNDEPPSVPPSNPVLRVIRGFGQLVGFVPPDGLVLVKRVIAVGGQTVQGINGTVRVRTGSGPWHTLDEPFVYDNGPDQRATFGPVTVPQGRLWVMGDHRNESADSRYHCGPEGADGPDNATCDATSATVPVGDVIGKAFVIAWPPSRWRTLGTPATFTAAAGDAAAQGLVPIGVVVPLFVLRRRRRRRSAA